MNDTGDCSDLLEAIADDNPKLENALHLKHRLERSGDTWEKDDSSIPYPDEIARLDGYVSFPTIGYSEIGLGHQLADRCGRESVEPSALECSFGQFKKLSQKQKEACEFIAGESISFLTGPPGSGKTTIVRSVIEYARRLGLSRIVLGSPTARGAMRLAEQCESRLPGRTLHSVLGYRGGSFRHNDQNPVEADLAICDEASMLDVELGNAWLRAFRPGTRFLFVGDANQLPSVGPGNFFENCVGFLPTVRLEEIFRTESGGPIGLACEDIRNGRPMVGYAGFGVEEFRITDVPTGSVGKLVMGDINKIARRLGISLTDIRLTAPTTERCRIVNSYMLEKYSNDIPIINKRNRKDDGIYNGDIGRLLTGGQLVDFGAGRVYPLCKDTMLLAYCITTHSVQGSEYPAVIGIMPRRQSKILSRKLLYTLVSRGGRYCWLVGDMQGVREAIEAGDRTRVTKLGRIIAKRIAANRFAASQRY